MNRTYTLSPGSPDLALELRKSLDPAASEAIIEELRQTVPRWGGLYEPSRVLWIGRLPSSVSVPRSCHKMLEATQLRRQGAPIFVLSPLGFHWSWITEISAQQRVGSRTTRFEYGRGTANCTSGSAAWVPLRGSPPRHRHCSMAVLYRTFYRVAYIPGWPASYSRPELLQWAYDIHHVTGGAVRTSLSSSVPLVY